MRRIFGIGETVLDIIFKDGNPVASKAGGSVLNSAVSLGRTGMPVSFISEYGTDEVGKIIDAFLKDNGVDTSLVHRFDEGATALALAFLDDRNDAHYTFYKDYPLQRLNISLPVINNNDILQCGSFYAILADIREKFLHLLSESVKNRAMVLYDPNFRRSHITEIETLRPLIQENMSFATLVRGSDEDFKNIFGAQNADEAWKEVKKYSKILVYTASDEVVTVKTNSYSGTFPVNKITPLSTIGAGDNFNAGMIAAIYNNSITSNDLEHMGEEMWSRVVGTGISFATEVCMSYENYVSKVFALSYSGKK